MKKKKRTRFQIITMIAVWAMIIFMLLSVILGAAAGIAQNYSSLF